MTNWQDFLTNFLWLAAIFAPFVYAGAYAGLGYLEPRMPAARYAKLKEIVDLAVGYTEQWSKRYDSIPNPQKKAEAITRIANMAHDAGIPKSVMDRSAATVDSLLEVAVAKLPQTYANPAIRLTPPLFQKNPSPITAPIAPQATVVASTPPSPLSTTSVTTQPFSAL